MEKKERKHYVHYFFLGKINPLNYEKIEFLGNNFNITRISWGNDPFYSEITVKDYGNTNLSNILKYNKANTDFLIYSNAKNFIQKVSKQIFMSTLNASQYFGLTWYYENENYSLHFLSTQYGRNEWGSNGAVFMGTGNCIRLYNDSNYDYFSARESENDNLQLLTQYSQIIYSELNKYFKYYWSEFNKHLYYFTTKNFYSFLEKFLNK